MRSRQKQKTRVGEELLFDRSPRRFVGPVPYGVDRANLRMNSSRKRERMNGRSRPSRDLLSRAIIHHGRPKPHRSSQNQHGTSNDPHR